MGRSIVEQNSSETVWQYGFGIQNPDQSRIVIQYGIGSYFAEVFDEWWDGGLTPMSQEEIDQEILNRTMFINEEGVYFRKKNVDRIVLTKEDLPKLKTLLPDDDTLRRIKEIDKAFWFGGCMPTTGMISDLYKGILAVEPEWLFWIMIDAYCTFIESHMDMQDEFIFDRER